MELFHGLCLEGNCTVKHGKEDNACAPEIYIQTVASVSKNLRRDISRSATLLTHNLVRLDLPGYTEICDFHVAFAVKEDVVKLNISMGDMLRVNVT